MLVQEFCCFPTDLLVVGDPGAEVVDVLVQSVRFLLLGHEQHQPVDVLGTVFLDNGDQLIIDSFATRVVLRLDG